MARPPGGPTITQPRQLSEADLDTLRRIERLPFGRFQWRLLWMGGLGYTFDALDGALMGFILTAVTALWALTDQQTGVLGSSAMIGYLFGAFFAGALGDLITRSFGYSIIIYLAQIPGYYSAAFLSEKLDRKWTIVVYMVLGGVSAYLLSSAGTGASITTAGVLLSFFMNGTYAGIYAYTPELYPTAFRTTGMGVASAFGRLGGLSAPIVIGHAYAQIGFGGVFVMTTVVLVTGALAVSVLGIATAGKSLEQITAETLHPREP